MLLIFRFQRHYLFHNHLDKLFFSLELTHSQKYFLGKLPMSEEFLGCSADMMSLAFFCDVKILHDSIRNLAFVAERIVERINDEIDGRVNGLVFGFGLFERMKIVLEEVSEILIGVHQIVL